MKPLEAKAGETCSFECILSRESSDAYTWSVNGNLVSAGERFDISKNGRTYTLTIKNVTSSDTGEVIFTIKDLVSKTTLFIEGMLTLLTYYIFSVLFQCDTVVIAEQWNLKCDYSCGVVGTAVSVSKELQTVCAVPGEDAVFICEMSEASPNIKWFKDGKGIQKSEKYNISQEENVMKLTIHNITSKDSGTYCCEILGGPSTKASLEVQGKSKSTFLEKTSYIEFTYQFQTRVKHDIALSNMIRLLPYLCSYI